MKKILLLLSITLFMSCSKKEKYIEISFSEHDLVNDSLAKSWDEGIPLGNGIIGALVWQKEDHLRMSLDNVTLWDLRPMENLNTPNYKFSWVYEQWKNDFKCNLEYKLSEGVLIISTKIGQEIKFNVLNQ